MDKKYQIFISSTYQDLKEERNEVLKAILGVGHIPVGMENFGAADEEQFSYIQDIIAQCDYYILLISGKYGSIANDGLSYTEKEYNYASEKGVTILRFLHEDIDILPKNLTEADAEKAMKLNLFRDNVSRDRLVDFYCNKDNLKAKVLSSLMKAFRDRPGVGWIRANSAASLDILNQINDLRIKNEKLEESLKICQEKQNKSPLANLAEMGEKIAIKYGKKDVPDYLYNNIAEITWREIFCYIGPNIFSPKPVDYFSRMICDLIGEKFKIDPSTINISVSSLNIIKVHLNNLTYVNFYHDRNSLAPSAELVMITGNGKIALGREAAVFTTNTQ